MNQQQTEKAYELVVELWSLPIPEFQALIPPYFNQFTHPLDEAWPYLQDILAAARKRWPEYVAQLRPDYTWFWPYGEGWFEARPYFEGFGDTDEIRFLDAILKAAKGEVK